MISESTAKCLSDCDLPCACSASLPWSRSNNCKASCAAKRATLCSKLTCKEQKLLEDQLPETINDQQNTGSFCQIEWRDQEDLKDRDAIMPSVLISFHDVIQKSRFRRFCIQSWRTFRLRPFLDRGVSKATCRS